MKETISAFFKCVVSLKERRQKKGIFYTTAQRKLMLKPLHKNELIRMVITNELVIAQMMKEFNITSLAKYKQNIK